MINLKPTTSFTFTKDDLDYVLQLAKVGHVNLLSSQVSLITKDKSFNFKVYNDDKNKECKGLTMPSNWCIEFIGTSENFICITFGVKKIETL